MSVEGEEYYIESIIKAPVDNSKSSVTIVGMSQVRWGNILLIDRIRNTGKYRVSGLCDYDREEELDKECLLKVLSEIKEWVEMDD